MTRKEREYVRDTVDNEGFHYAFTDYTDFLDTVEDPEFHRLRRAYLAAAQALEDYYA